MSISRFAPLIAFACIAFSARVEDAPAVELEAGVSRIRHEGFRHFGARSLRDTLTVTRDRDSVFARVGYRLGDSWSFGIGYIDHGSESFEEVSPDTNIFGNPNIGAYQILTPYQVTQRLKETTLDLRYRLQATQWLAVEAGPILSRYDFRSTVAGVAFSDDEYRLGGQGGVSLRFTDNVEATLSYRYARATETRMNLLSLGIRYRF